MNLYKSNYLWILFIIKTKIIQNILFIFFVHSKDIGIWRLKSKMNSNKKSIDFTNSQI